MNPFEVKRLKPEWGDEMPPGTYVFEQWLHHFAKQRVAGNSLLDLKPRLRHTVMFSSVKYSVSKNIHDVALEYINIYKI
jgi:hypothetical protein